MNTEKYETKWFIVHSDFIYNNEDFEKHKIYIDIEKINSIKDIVDKYIIETLKDEKFEDEKEMKKFIKFNEKEFIKDLENNKIILYKQKEYKLKNGKIIKYEPMQIIIQTVFENIMQK